MELYIVFGTLEFYVIIKNIRKGKKLIYTKDIDAEQSSRTWYWLLEENHVKV
jgi:hypothetical protein